MKAILKTVLAVIAGLVAGSVVNMVIVNLGPMVIPLPEGADVSSMEALRETMLLFQPYNFIPPFLGHALGTLAGAYLAVKLAGAHGLRIGLGLGVLFLLGGIAAVVMLGGPLWFKVADLVLAYLPMGYLGAKLAGGLEK